MAGYPINQLPALADDEVSGGDQLPVFVTNQGTAYKLSITNLLSFFTANFASPDITVVTSIPTDGATVSLASQTTDSVWLVMRPIAALTALTITLPPLATAFDGQEVLVTSTQPIAALTINGNGATVIGAPGSMGNSGASGDEFGFRLRYLTASEEWHVISTNTGNNPKFTSVEALLVATDDVALTGAGSISGAGTIAGPADITITAVTSASLVSSTGDASLVATAGRVLLTATADDVTISAGDDVFLTAADDMFLTAAGDDIRITAGDQVQLVPGSVTTTTKPIVITPVLVGSLVAAATAGSGARAHVTDATVTTFASNVVGGGANNVPVYSDGTNWKIG